MTTIRIIFSDKADANLEEIIKKFDLEETLEDSIKKNKENKLLNIIIIDRLIQNLALGTIAYNDLINSLEKELFISHQIAEQISKEITTTIIPFLEKIPTDKISDKAFIKEVSEKIFGDTVNTKSELPKNGYEDVFPKVETPINYAEQPKKEIILPKKERIKKSIPTEEIKKSQPQPNKPNSPDNYREPIE